MNEEIKLPINLMIDTVFNNYNDDTELLARWLFKNGYINKNEDGNYIKNKDYKSIFINSKYEEIKEYDYCFKQLQNQLQAYKDKEDKYKNAWDELKKYQTDLDKTNMDTLIRDNSEFYHYQRGNMMGHKNIGLKIQELEKKHGIEVE